MRPAEKTALTTGAAREIGRTFAQSYLAEGAKAVIADINLDMADESSIDSAADGTVEKLRQIDILINNEALFRAALIAEISPDDYDTALAGNFKGRLFTLHAVARHMIEREHCDGVDAFIAKYENKAPGQKKKEVGGAVPFGRTSTAEDLTGLAVFPASDAASYIVAQTYNVDGGQWMS